MYTNQGLELECLGLLIFNLGALKFPQHPPSCTYGARILYHVIDSDQRFDSAIYRTSKNIRCFMIYNSTYTLVYFYVYAIFRDKIVKHRNLLQVCVEHKCLNDWYNGMRYAHNTLYVY